MMIHFGTLTSTTRQPARVTMKRPFHRAGRFIVQLLLTTTITTTTFVIQPVVAQTFTRAAACENEPTLIGYSNITDLNEDMMTELDRIAGGGQVPADAYSFVLCSGVTFDMRGPTPLLPVLSQANFVCGGPNSVPPVECIMDGSEQQILIQDSTIPEYVPSFTVTGVIFNGFRRGMSAELRASSPSVARFVDCTWRVRILYSAQESAKERERGSTEWSNTIVNNCRPNFR
jgi:hypothetical protein